MNIIKYLRKANVETKYDSTNKIFNFTINKVTKKYTQKEIEQYLFIRLLELIENE